MQNVIFSGKWFSLLIVWGRSINELLALRFNPMTDMKKGPMQDMTKKRGIFLSNVISKVYEKVLRGRNKTVIDSKVSEDQGGVKEERYPADHVILVADVVRRNREMGRKTYFVFGDAVKCFDKLAFWYTDYLIGKKKVGMKKSRHNF